MRDQKRIQRISDKVAIVWNQVPDMRLGQLICNIARWNNVYDAFYMEDDVLEQALDGAISGERDDLSRP